MKVCKKYAKNVGVHLFLHTTGTLCKNTPYTPRRGVYIREFLHSAVQPLAPLVNFTVFFAHPDRRMS